MELVLNLVWAAIAVGSLVGWYLMAGRHLAPRERTTQAIALVVLLALLFPVISLTDDLQAATTMAETEHPGRKILAAAEHAPPPVLLFAGLLELGLALGLMRTARALPPRRSIGMPSAGTVVSKTSRGPPAWLCA